MNTKLLGFRPHERLRLLNMQTTTARLDPPPVRLRDWLKLFATCAAGLAAIVYGLPLIAAAVGVGQ